MNLCSYHRGVQNQKSTFNPQRSIHRTKRCKSLFCYLQCSVNTYIAFPIHSKHSLIMAMQKGGKILNM
jgi:hypothetical protein